MPCTLLSWISRTWLGDTQPRVQRDRCGQRMALVLGSLLLTACSADSSSDLQEWVQAQRASARPRVVPLEEPKRFQPQEYRAAQGVDPFSQLKLTNALRRDAVTNVQSASLIVPEQNRRKQELESYPLDMMTMVGSMDRQGQMTGLVRVDRLLYQVRPGQYLGQNYGRIERVTENHIQLRELMQDPSGDWIEKTTHLELQEASK